MSLLEKEYKELEQIQEKILADNALSSEMETFLDLIVKSGNEVEVLGYMNTLGFSTIEEVRGALKKHQKYSAISTGLAIAGGAVLLAMLFSK
ncbi:hypothetical protein SPBRAN_1815 [uncultured Candidatus Thioglobus sp.]|nr:hypothetical protein SPBRAN_1815 [uncultured Candidatus Thioglobus sp.]